MIAMNVDENGDYKKKAVQDVDYEVLEGKMTEYGMKTKVTEGMKKNFRDLKSGSEHQDINKRMRMDLDSQFLKDR